MLNIRQQLTISLSITLALPPQILAAQEPAAGRTCGEKAEEECIGASDRTSECRATILGDCMRDEAETAKLQNHKAAASLYHGAYSSYLKAFTSISAQAKDQRQARLQDALSMLDKEIEQWLSLSDFSRAFNILREAKRELEEQLTAFNESARLSDASSRLDKAIAHVHRSDATQKQLSAEDTRSAGMAAEKFLEAADAWAQARASTRDCGETNNDLKQELSCRLSAIDQRRAEVARQNWSACDTLRTAKESITTSRCGQAERRLDEEWIAITARIELELQVCGETEGRTLDTSLDTFCMAKWFETTAERTLSLPAKAIAFKSRGHQVGWIVQELAKRALEQYESVATQWDLKKPAAAQETRKHAKRMLTRLSQDRDFQRLALSLLRPNIDGRRFVGRERRFFITGMTLLSAGFASLVPAVALTVAASSKCGTGGLLSCAPPEGTEKTTLSFLSGAQAMFVVAGTALAAGAVFSGLAIAGNRRSRRLPSCTLSPTLSLVCGF